MPETECYIVLGPPRTGTSLAAGLLQNLGVYGGEPTDFRRGSNNPHYYEHQLVFEFVSGRIPSFAPLVGFFSRFPKWFIKQPRLLQRWDEVEPLLPAYRFVVTHRYDKTAQYQSHRRAIRNQTREEFEQRTKRYYADLLEITGGHPRADVWFEDWFEDTTQLEYLAEFVGLPLTQPAIELVDPTLKHY